MLKRLFVAAFVLSLVVASLPLAFAQDDMSAVVYATVETAATPEDAATGVAIWLHPSDPAQSLIIGTDDDFGLMVYDLDGVELQQIQFEEGVAGNLDIRYNFPLGDSEITIIAAGVKDEPLVKLLTVDSETREVSIIGDVETSIPHSGLCMYRSTFTDTFYFFINSDDGDVEQWALDGSSGEITASLARELSVGSDTEGCTIDDELANFFISEEEVALWRYGAEPEDGNSRAIVDVIGPHIDEQIEGLTVYMGADGMGYLIGADEAGSAYVVYTRDGSEFIGEFQIGEGDTDAVEEPGGIDVINVPMGAFDTGLFVSADDANDDGNNNFKLVPFGDIADALGLELDTEASPRGVMTNLTGVALVVADGETIPVPSGADAADDPAIWIHPTDPSQSLILGTDKTAGLVTYNLDGSIFQVLNVGNVNNVDLRYNFPLGDRRVAIVTATNRTDNTIEVWAINDETRELESVRGEAYVGVDAMREVYGHCMYHSPISGKYYAFPNGTNGTAVQLELVVNADGLVDLVPVRTLAVETQTEGCVADDELAVFYLGEEGRGIWRYDAEPDGSTDGTLIAETDGNPLTADVEGLSIYYGSMGDGYLIASSQGSSHFVVYDRVDNSLVGVFQIIESPTVDGVSGTDGFDVTNFPLGDAYPEGLFVTQDDRNILPDDNQNFKLVSWATIAAALDLTVDTAFDPRTIGAE